MTVLNALKNSNQILYKVLFPYIFRFNEVLVETGLLLIHPLLKDSNKSRAIIRAATTINRDKMKMMLQRRGRGLSIMMKLPTEGIKGSNCITGQTPDSMWYPHQVKKERHHEKTCLRGF